MRARVVPRAAAKDPQPKEPPEFVPYSIEGLAKSAAIRDQQVRLQREAVDLLQAELKAHGVDPATASYASIVANGIIVGLRRLTPQEIAQTQQAQRGQ